MEFLADLPRFLVVWGIPAVIAITLHEAAHGWVAWRLGDPTAKMLGRVTFNPIRHIDPFGTVLLPGLLLLSGTGFLFGYARPVPVNFRNLAHGRLGMVAVAAAGPGINLILAMAAAALFALLLAVPGTPHPWIPTLLINMLIFNVFLAVFNMLPVPPLDGGRVAVGLLPLPLARALARLEHVGIFLILGVLFLLPWLASRVGVDLPLSRWLIGIPSDLITRAIAALFGLAA